MRQFIHYELIEMLNGIHSPIEVINFILEHTDGLNNYLVMHGNMPEFEEGEVAIAIGKLSNPYKGKYSFLKNMFNETDLVEDTKENNLKFWNKINLMKSNNEISNLKEYTIIEIHNNGMLQFLLPRFD